METATTDTARTESPKDSATPGEVLALKRIALAKSGRHPGATDADVDQAYARLQADRQASAADDRRQAESDYQRVAHALKVDGWRAMIRRAGDDPAGMTDGELQRRAESLADRVPADESRRKSAERALKRRDAARRFAAAGVPRRAAAELDRIDARADGSWREHRDLLHEQSRYEQGFIFGLIGVSGTGKTQLAASLIRRCCEDGLDCRYVKAVDLLRDVRRSYVQVGRGERGVSEAEVVDRWASWDLLVIDEFHQRGGTAAEATTLTNLIDRRHDEMLLTVLIANQTRDDFDDGIGDSVVSRMIQTGRVLECTWPTFRKPDHWRQTDGSTLRTPRRLIAKGTQTA